MMATSLHLNRVGYKDEKALPKYNIFLRYIWTVWVIKTLWAFVDINIG